MEELLTVTRSISHPILPKSIMKHILIICSLLLAITASPLNAATKVKTAADLKKEEDDKKAKIEAQKEVFKEHFEALKTDLPSLNLSDVYGISEVDLRKLYERAFSAKGMKMMEAKQKAQTMTINLKPEPKPAATAATTAKTTTAKATTAKSTTAQPESDPEP